MQSPTSDEYVEIDSIPLHLDAWVVTNLEVLWEGADTRGTDQLLPGAVGVRANPRRPTVSRRDLQLVVNGYFDLDGNRTTNARTALEENLDFLQSNIVDPPGGDGTREATLHLPSGATRTGAVTVEAFTLAGMGPAAAKAVLTITIKNGRLTEPEGS